MQDRDLELLTLKELFYLKDELNEMYAELKQRCSEWEQMHALVSDEFKVRKEGVDAALHIAEEERKQATQMSEEVFYKYMGEYDENTKNNLH